MTRRTFAGATMGFAAWAVCPAASPQDEAQKAAETWLAMVDRNQYSESWEAAAAAFKQQVARNEWEAMLSKVRVQLGAMQSRSLTSATFTTQLPDGPEGEFVILQYATSFANAPEVTETVTPMKDPDGVWRVSGYYAR